MPTAGHRLWRRRPDVARGRPDDLRVVFQMAGSVGVAAHVVEEYAEEPLRWRGRDPQG
ncbi:MAG: hypothetical protein HOQ21_10435 [Dermatophilaceae bacterium]|nr:hypothetical protein [Dermatophilaceae bacterium]